MKAKSKKSPQSSKPAKVRIIGGSWRGRLLTFNELDGLRPTGDRIRETLFNWLAPDLPESRCLDLFAGSGALGFEALSRGASHATLVEKQPQCVNELRANAARLNASNFTIAHQDALQYLQQAATPFDIIFIDPPFSEHLWSPVIQQLVKQNWLAPGALLYIEKPVQSSLDTPCNWHKIKHKKAGQVEFSLYENQMP